MKKKSYFNLYQKYLARSESTQSMYWVSFGFLSPIVLEVDDVQREKIFHKHMKYNYVSSFFTIFVPVMFLELFPSQSYLASILMLIFCFLYDMGLKWMLKKELTTYPKKPLFYFLSLKQKTDTAEQIQMGLLKKKRWLSFSLILLMLVASVPFFYPSLSFSNRSSGYFPTLVLVGALLIIRWILTINQINAEGRSHLMQS